jgi:hypothetical protein
MQSDAIGRASDRSNALQREGQQHAIDALEQGRTDAVGALRGGQTDTIAAQRAALAQARTDLEPWRGQGANALTVASNLSGANGPEAAALAQQDFFTSPGYQWRLDEGMRAVDAGAAAQGMLRSGATLKGEQKFAQGLASQEFGDYYNRLYQLSGLGANAAAATGGYEMQTGQNLGNAYLNTAGRLGDTYTGSAGRIAGAYTGTAQDVARQTPVYTATPRPGSARRSAGLAATRNSRAGGTAARSVRRRSVTMRSTRTRRSTNTRPAHTDPSHERRSAFGIPEPERPIRRGQRAGAAAWPDECAAAG